MSPSENGKDKDFVLSSSYPGGEELDPGEEAYYQTGNDSSSGSAFKPIHIAITGFFILIILSVVVIARTYSLADKAQILALESRLEQLESRLGSIEGEGGLAQGAGSQLILLTERLDQLEANMTARINSVANQLSTTAAKPAPPAVEKAATATPTEGAKTAKAPANESKAKIYTVQKGDTLYRISHRFNLSVDQLRQYNKLDSGASIYPGQKLNITPPK